MRKMFFAVVLLVVTGFVHAEPGAIKVGAVINLHETHDVSLVEFLTFNTLAEGKEIPLASLNLGGSYRGESLGIAALIDAKGFFAALEKLRYWPKFLTFSALDFEAGLYVSRQFTDAKWDVGFCSTLFSHKF
jgi:hypothetical protein